MISTRPPTFAGEPIRMLWRYLRRETIYLAWALMEASLLAAFAIGMMRWTRLWPPMLVLFLLVCFVLIPFNLSRIMMTLGLTVRRQRTAHLLGLGVAIYFAVRMVLFTGYWLDPRWLAELFRSLFSEGNIFWSRSLMVAVLVAVSWGRGISMTDRDVDIDGMGLRIRVGALILAPLAVGLAGRQQAIRVAPLILVFFFAMLMAISLTRAEEIADSRYSQGQAIPPRWLGVVGLASLLIVLAAGILAAILSGNAVDVLRGWLGPLWIAVYLAGTVVLQTVGLVVQPVFALLAAIIDRLFFLLSNLFAQLNPQPADQESAGAQALIDQLQELNQNVEPVQIPFEYGRIALIVLVALFALLVTLGVVRGFRFRSIRLLDDGSHVQRAPSAQAREGGLRGFLDRLAGIRRWRMAASIRRIYMQMCEVGAAFGYPRAESETPFEYLSSLQHVWPDSEEQVGLVTDAYVRVRYGEVPETAEELEEIRAAWRQLQQTIVASE